jgi:hypothetical protein
MPRHRCQIGARLLDLRGCYGVGVAITLLPGGVGGALIGA